MAILSRSTFQTVHTPGCPAIQAFQTIYASGEPQKIIIITQSSLYFPIERHYNPINHQATITAAR